MSAAPEIRQEDFARDHESRFPLPRLAPWLLAPIVLFAALLRIAGLGRRGFLYWDEGKFALEGIRLLSVIQRAAGLHAVVAGKAVGTAKPSHALLIACSYLLFGIHDYAPLYLSALASVLGVAVLFVLGRQIFGSEVALIASLLLAVSGYDLVYARSALSESDATVLFMIGVLLWWERQYATTYIRGLKLQTGPLIAGLVLGLAFTTNYRLIVYIATLVAIDIACLRGREGLAAAGASAVTWIGGLALIPLLWQIAGMVATSHGIVLFQSEITNRPVSYLSEVLYQLHGGRQASLHADPAPYVQWLVGREGWLLAALLLAGFFVAIRKRTLCWLLPASLVAVPLAVYSFAPFIVPRNLSAAIPFACLLSAAALQALVKWIPVPRPRVAVLVVALLILTLFGSIRDWPLTAIRSGFAEAAMYVDSHGSAGALALNEVMRFYLRDPGQGCDAPMVPLNPTALQRLDRRGYDFVIVDRHTELRTEYLSRYARLVAAYPVSNVSPFGENLIDSENGFPPTRLRADRVRIYRLNSFRERDKTRETGGACSLDQLG